jgi:alpha-beta hydrolase superfamily lysophospholipase
VIRIVARGDYDSLAVYRPWYFGGMPHAAMPDLLTRIDSAGTELHLEHYRPAGQPHLALVMVHGFSTHCGLYRHVGAHFATLDMAVTQYDQRGHGGSAGPRGHVQAFHAYVDDLAAVIGWARDENPDLPLAVVGHSMGATVALALALDRTGRESPDLLVLAAPWLKLRMKVLAPAPSSETEPAHERETRALPNGMTGEALSRNPEFQRAFARDPRVHHVATLGWFTSMLRAQAHIKMHVGSLACPTLFVLAGNDRIVANEASLALVKRTQAFVEVRTYETSFHELYWEPEGPQVLNGMADWLLERLRKQTA